MQTTITLLLSAMAAIVVVGLFFAVLALSLGALPAALAAIVVSPVVVTATVVKATSRRPVRDGADGTGHSATR